MLPCAVLHLRPVAFHELSAKRSPTISLLLRCFPHSISPFSCFISGKPCSKLERLSRPGTKEKKNCDTNDDEHPRPATAAAAATRSALALAHRLHPRDGWARHVYGPVPVRAGGAGAAVRAAGPRAGPRRRDPGVRVGAPRRLRRRAAALLGARRLGGGPHQLAPAALPVRPSRPPRRHRPARRRPQHRRPHRRPPPAGHERRRRMDHRPGHGHGHGRPPEHRQGRRHGKKNPRPRPNDTCH